MVRTPEQDLERELQDPEFAKLFGAALAKAEFAVTLANARRGARLTQKELSDRLGRSQPYIAKLEAGDANPTLGTVGSLLAVLGLRLRMHTQPLMPSQVALSYVASKEEITGIGEKRIDDANRTRNEPETQHISITKEILARPRSDLGLSSGIATDVSRGQLEEKLIGSAA